MHPGIDKHFGAYDTGKVGAVQNRTGDGDSVSCSLNYDVLFCMKCSAEFMAFSGRYSLLFPQTTDIQAVFQPCGSSVVSGGQYPPFLYQNSTDFAP